ncbi:hypothetical protein [Flavobacterium aestuarii]|uniref:hypothetical protein n=1 Tax=Flavobacterium aestuarii TaxID=3149227 RepID=UPI0032B5BAF0
MTQTYLLEWLDSVITETLNAKKKDIHEITGIQSKVIIETAMHETQQIQSQLTIQIFSLTNEKHIKVLVGNYYLSLLFLSGKVREANSSNDMQGDNLKEVAAVLISCLSELLNFIETRFSNYLNITSQINGNNVTGTSVIENVSSKVLCKLSTDQTALILRASDELKILMSKSMNHLFKTIVPFLSTPNKADLSYDAMRSKAYVAEERDKEIAIETLERMIKRIREY